MSSLLAQVGLSRSLLAARALFGSSAASTRSVGTLAWTPAASFGGSGGSGAGRNAGRGTGGSGGGGSNFGRRFGILSMFALSSVTLMAGTAHAAAKNAKSEVKLPDGKELTIDNVTEALWAVSGPILTNLGFSGCIGLCCGYALKKIGQTAAVLIGISFMVLQGLAHQGIITVNWGTVSKQVNAALDINKDGVVDEKDFKIVVGSGLGMFAQGVPTVAGFLAGFVMGIRM